MRKIIKILLLIFICFIYTEVKAETYNGILYDIYHPDSGFTVFAEESNRWMDYNSWMIKSSIDDKTYYCIDPSLALGKAPSGSFNYITGTNNIIGKANITKEKYEKIKLISYYGYGYRNKDINHTSKKWYGITQVMIWRIMRPDLTWTFKSNRNSVPDKNLFKDEIAEINKLIKNHKKIPSFAETTKNILIGETITLTDTNNVFKYFFRVNTLKNISLEEEGNKIKITGLKQGSQVINYSFRNGLITPIELLTSSKYQDIITRGNPNDLPYFQFKVNVTGGVLNLYKIDSNPNNNQQGDATLENALFEIYDLNNKKIGEIKTDNKGYGKIILDYGKYKLKEIKAPVGYEIDNKIYEFEINKDNTSINLKVKNKVISGKVILTKKKGGSGENISFEKDAVFEIINSSGKVIDTIITNNEGKAEILLPYGDYTIHQIKGAKGYVLAEDTHFSIKESKIYKIDLTNLKLSKLKITKIDKDTKENLKGAIIEIYKNDNTFLFKGETDKNGILEIPELEIGKYYFKEIKAPKYYKINNNKIYFNVSKNGELLKIKIENEINKGKLLIHKIDSKTGKKLPNVYIKITSCKDNKKVFYGKTDKNGKIEINNIKAGKYYIHEEKTLKNYLLNNQPILFELKNDNEKVEITITNKMQIKVPNTLKNNINLIITSGILLISIGCSLLIYERKKK